MSAVLEQRLTLNTFHKMDNVLYEIKDNNGITKNFVYEEWKSEVLKDLLSGGYIKVKGDFYIITSEGKEVIEHESFLYYNKRLKLEKVADQPLTTKDFSLSFGFLLLVIGILSTAIIWSELKFQWISNVF